MLTVVGRVQRSDVGVLADITVPPRVQYTRAPTVKTKPTNSIYLRKQNYLGSVALNNIYTQNMTPIKIQESKTTYLEIM